MEKQVFIRKMCTANPVDIGLKFLSPRLMAAIRRPLHSSSTPGFGRVR